MDPKSLVIKNHKAVLYATTLGLAVYGVMAIFNPEVLSAGFDRFTQQDWNRFQTDNHVLAAYVTLLWRLIGGFNLAVGLTLALVAWKWLRPGHSWAWTTLFLGTLISYLSPMSLDVSVRSIGSIEVFEFVLFGLFVISMLGVRCKYFPKKVSQGELQ
jgi:hypothetical protein